MSVTDITEQLQLRRAREHYARLSAQVNKQREEVMRDPLPHLARMAQQVARYKQAIEEADHYLAGDGELLPSGPSRSSPPFSTLLMARIDRAREVLGVAMEDPPATIIG